MMLRQHCGLVGGRDTPAAVVRGVVRAGVADIYLEIPGPLVLTTSPHNIKMYRNTTLWCQNTGHFSSPMLSAQLPHVLRSLIWRRTATRNGRVQASHTSRRAVRDRCSGGPATPSNSTECVYVRGRTAEITDAARASGGRRSIFGEAHFCHTLVRRACSFDMAGLTSGATPDAAWMANCYCVLPGFEGSAPISGRPTVGDSSLIPRSEEMMPHRQAGIGLQRQVARENWRCSLGAC